MNYLNTLIQNVMNKWRTIENEYRLAERMRYIVVTRNRTAGVYNINCQQAWSNGSTTKNGKLQTFRGKGKIIGLTILF